MPLVGIVLLLFGLNGSVSSWNTAKAAYEAQGYQVHALQLPRAGWSAGDTKVNADYVEGFIAQNGLTNVKVDGHSLGGWLALELIEVRKNPAITKGVLRDTGYGCFFGIPGDQCSGSALLTGIAAAVKATPPTVPVLNLNHLSTALPGVTKLTVYNISHAAFLTDSRVNAAAVAW